MGSAASACMVVLSLAAMVDSVTHGRERVARRAGTQQVPRLICGLYGSFLFVVCGYLGAGVQI